MHTDKTIFNYICTGSKNGKTSLCTCLPPSADENRFLNPLLIEDCSYCDNKAASLGGRKKKLGRKRSLQQWHVYSLSRVLEVCILDLVNIKTNLFVNKSSCVLNVAIQSSVGAVG